MILTSSVWALLHDSSWLCRRVLFEPLFAGGEIGLELFDVGAAAGEFVVGAEQAGDVVARGILELQHNPSQSESSESIRVIRVIRII